jgi:hypothetical protein
VIAGAAGRLRFTAGGCGLTALFFFEADKSHISAIIRIRTTTPPAINIHLLPELFFAVPLYLRTSGLMSALSWFFFGCRASLSSVLIVCRASLSSVLTL